MTARQIQRLLAIVAMMLALPADADSGPSIYAQEAPGVVLIRVASTAKNSTLNESGTGFIISKSGHVLTAGHVVPDDADPKTLVVSASLGPNTAASPKRYQLQIVSRSKTYDAVLLRMINPPKDLQPLPLRNKAAVSGEQLFVLGFPLGMPDVHFLDGRVSAVSESDLTTNALINKGNSGGPVVDAVGCVIGLVYSGIESSNGEIVNGIKFAVPLTAIDTLIPTDARALASTENALPVDTAIHVSDTLSRIQTDHPIQLGDFVKKYDDKIDARPGYVIEEIESVEKTSLNPPGLQFPTPVLSPDKKSMLFTYSLISGPIFDQRRGWIDMTINTRQRPAGPPNILPLASNRCP